MSYTSIAGINFIDAILDGVLIDCWIGQIHLIIGEVSSPPFSPDSPKYYKFVFTEVIKINCHMDRYFFYSKHKDSQAGQQVDESPDWEDIDCIESKNASDDINIFANERDGVKRIIFKDPIQLGRTWRVRDSTCVRKFLLESDLQRIEFLYSGEVKILELSEEKYREEKSSQFNRFFLPEQG
jgi:hypothetical protein